MSVCLLKELTLKEEKLWIENDKCKVGIKIGIKRKEMIILVPDGTLGFKRYRARSAIMAGAKPWFLRLLYFQLTPIFLILLTKGMKKGIYIMGRKRQNRPNSFVKKIPL